LPLWDYVPGFSLALGNPLILGHWALLTLGIDERLLRLLQSQGLLTRVDIGFSFVEIPLVLRLGLQAFHGLEPSLRI
jgi:hypothetical protein